MRPDVHADLPGPAPFRVLHVCIANQCRSPMAERITRAELAVRLGPYADHWSVTGAGTRAHEGHAMHACAEQTLRSLGADADNFAARRLTPALLRESDLVLTATAAERDTAISLLPAALRRTFTLLEFARLVAAVPPELVAQAPEGVTARPLALVPAAQRMRGRTGYVEPHLDDVEDPPRDAQSFQECAALITGAVRTILDVLCAAPMPRHYAITGH